MSGQETIPGTRKEMKSAARAALKGHYAIYVFMVLVLVTIGGIETAGSQGLGVIRQLMNSDRSSALNRSYSADDAFSTVLIDAATGDREQDESLPALLKRERGILSTAMKHFSSGAIMTWTITTVIHMIERPTLPNILLRLLALFIYALVWIFILNLIQASVSRLLLEGRVYERLPVSHLGFIPSMGCWGRAGWTLFLKSIYQQLWNLTIIGGMIKAYSYLLVPYIVAENPSIRANEAITLSRRMMNGHKWEFFVNDLSFLGWHLLSVLTLGLSGFFFSEPYYHAFRAEFYAVQRRRAKEEGLEGAEALNDEWLFEKAGGEALSAAYADLTDRRARQQAETPVVLSGFRAFASKFLGVWLGKTGDKIRYQNRLNREAKIEAEERIIGGQSYPTRLNPLYMERTLGGRETGAVKKRFLMSFTQAGTRLYTVWSLAAMFFIFCFAGWFWEVLLHFMQEHELVNRGTLYGPWLPIYGTGGLLILVLLYSLKKNPFVQFAAAIILCGLVEYLMAKDLEDVKLLRYWSYKGYALNLDGRICAEGLLLFGIMGVVTVYLAGPSLDDLISGIPLKILIPASLALIALFAVDTVYSDLHPHEGSGVSEDLCIAGWPTTFFQEDTLPLNEQEAKTLRRNIEDHDLLEAAGYSVDTKEDVERYQADGTAEQLRLEKEAEEAQTEEKGQEKEHETAA